MLCARCELLEHAAPGERSPREAGEEGWQQLEGIVCSRCGALLPLVPASDLLLDGLARLARFGLVAGAHPVVLRRPT